MRKGLARALVWAALAAVALVAAEFTLRPVVLAWARSRYALHVSAEFHRERKWRELHSALIRYGDAHLNPALMKKDGFESEEQEGVHLWVKVGPSDTTDKTSMELVAYVPSQHDLLVVVVYEKFQCVTLSPRAFVTTLEMPLSPRVWSAGPEEIRTTVTNNSVRLFRVLFEKGYIPPADALREATKVRLPFLEREEIIVPEHKPLH
jgi:hypothetical protein